MKSSDFSTCLKQVAALLAAAKAQQLAGELTQLSELFATVGSKKVIDVVAKLDAINADPAGYMQAKLDPLGQVIETVAPLCKVLAPKSSVDFEEVAAVLRRHGSASSEQWFSLATQALVPPAKKGGGKKVATPPNVELVDRYERLLERALGDDPGFRDVFSQLENDECMRPAEVSLLAKRFAAVSVKARSGALKKIFARHQALMTSRAASAATAGRIAG